MAAARTVFAERGIPGASVEEICEAAGFTRGAFYSNFPDKARAGAGDDPAAGRDPVRGSRASGRHDEGGRRLPPEELLAIALTAFEPWGSEEPRETLLADRELLLHAAREAELRGPYLAFMDDCMVQIAGLVQDALAHAGLELTVPVEHAVRVLAATHDHLQVLELLGEPAHRPAGGLRLGGHAHHPPRVGTSDEAVPHGLAAPYRSPPAIAASHRPDFARSTAASRSGEGARSAP